MSLPVSNLFPVLGLCFSSGLFWSAELAVSFPATLSDSKEAPARSKLLDEMIRALAVTPCAMARMAAETKPFGMA